MLFYFLQRTWLLTAFAVGVTGLSFGATFTANNGGTLGVSSTIGSDPGNDYHSLSAAAADFSATTGPAVAANYTFYIDTDTSESGQTAWGKATNGFTVTIKPSPGKTPTIEFDGGTQNNNHSSFNVTSGGEGCPGQLIIGLNGLTNTNAGIENEYVRTDNFVIDGSNTPSGTTRDLTIIASNPALINGRTVHILGSDNCVVKNCKINADGGSPSFCVYVTTLKVPIPAGTAYTNRYNSLNTVITNNELISVGSGSSRPIVINSIYDGQASNASSFPIESNPPIPSGWVISNNEIQGRNNSLYLNLAAGGTITSNTITSVNGGSGVQACINHLNVRGATNWTMEISKNSFPQTDSNVTQAGGMAVLRLGNSTGTADGAGTYDVFNNFIVGPTNNTNANAAFSHAIRGQSGASAYNIQHNSINMLDSSVASTQATGDNLAAISLTAATRTAVGTIRNNLIRLAQPNAAGISQTSADNTKLVTDGNDVALVGTGTSFGRLGGTAQATLAGWQTATGQEALGQTVDPTATSGSAWSSAAATDLHFVPGNVAPGGLNGGVATATTGITTDIDGQTRNASAPTVGADEVIPGAAVQDWAIY